MKRFILDWLGPLLGFLLLLGPPSWSEVNRGTTIALVVTLMIAAGFGLVLLFLVVKAQKEPPYIQ